MGVIARLPAAGSDRQGTEETEAAWQGLHAGEFDGLLFTSDGRAAGPDERPRIVFPGAFNPLHHGHRRIASVAQARTGNPPVFEISVANVDKPPIDQAEAFARVEQFAGAHSVVLTRAPTFVEKSLLFPGSTFVIGIDTVVRIANPKYYASPRACEAALHHLGQQEVRFLVFGRKHTEADRFFTLEDVTIPLALSQLCDAVAEEEFRADISSTTLRTSASPR